MPRIPLEIAQRGPISPRPTPADFGLAEGRGLERLAQGIDDVGKGVGDIASAEFSLERAEQRRQAGLLATRLESEYRTADQQALAETPDADQYKENVENRRRAIDAEVLEGASPEVLTLLERRKLELGMTAEFETRQNVRARRIDTMRADLAGEEHLARTMFETEINPKKRTKIRQNLFESYDEAFEDGVYTAKQVADFKIAFDEQTAPNLKQNMDLEWVQTQAAFMEDFVSRGKSSDHIDSLEGTPDQKKMLRTEMRQRYADQKLIEEERGREEMTGLYGQIIDDPSAVDNEAILKNGALTDKQKISALKFKTTRLEKGPAKRRTNPAYFQEVVGEMSLPDQNIFNNRNLFQDLADGKVSDSDFTKLLSEQNARLKGQETDYGKLIVKGTERANVAFSSTELDGRHRFRFQTAYTLAWIARAEELEVERLRPEDEIQITAELLEPSRTRLPNPENLNQPGFFDFDIGEVQNFQATVDQQEEQINGDPANWRQSWGDLATRVAEEEGNAHLVEHATDDVKRQWLRKGLERQGSGLFDTTSPLRTSPVLSNDPRVRD
jgi:hypothetical protein